MIEVDDNNFSEEYYYHVSLKRLKNKIFRPRIPKERLTNENDNIPRICVSNSIEGCLTAVKHNIFEDVILEEYRTGKKVPIFIYGIKKDSVQFVKTPHEISIYVQDAVSNSEYWILDKEVQMDFISTINLNMLHCVVDISDCSECCYTVNCHGCEKPNDWNESKEGKWIYKKDCYYPFVDDYEIKWIWTKI